MYYLFPFILCTLPVHCIFAQNIGEVSLRKYFEVLLLVILIVIAGCAGLNIFIHNLLLSELIFSLVFFALLYANNFFIKYFSEYKRSLLSVKIKYSVFYLSAIIFISILMYFLLSAKVVYVIAKTTFYLSIFITFFVILDILAKLSKYKFDDDIEFDVKEETNLPDIYHILADSHAGFYFSQYSDDLFKQELLKRGFNIYENAKSNYTCTHLSVPSCFNFNYIQNFVPNTGNVYEPVQTWHLYAKNKLFDILKCKGYKFNFILDSFFLNMNLCHYTGKDGFINTSKDTENIIISAFHFSSIFSFFIKKKSKKTLEKNVIGLLEKYKSFSKNNSDKPVYNYMHILAPHPPCFVDENGKQVQQQYTSESFISYQKYIDKKLLDVIDCIQKNMKKNSIILIHSDHTLDDTYSDETPFHILLAGYFPDKKVADNIPSNCSLVNLFPYIFNALWGDGHSVLDNRFYKILRNTNVLKELDIKD